LMPAACRTSVKRTVMGDWDVFDGRTRRSLLRAGGTCAQRQKDAARSLARHPPSKSVHSISHAWAAQEVVIRSGSSWDIWSLKKLNRCPNSSIRYSPPQNRGRLCVELKAYGPASGRCQLQKPAVELTIGMAQLRPTGPCRPQFSTNAASIRFTSRPLRGPCCLGSGFQHFRAFSI